MQEEKIASILSFIAGILGTVLTYVISSKRNKIDSVEKSMKYAQDIVEMYDLKNKELSSELEKAIRDLNLLKKEVDKLKLLIDELNLKSGLSGDVFDSMPAPYWVVTPDGSFITFNRSAKSLFNLSSDDVGKEESSKINIVGMTSIDSSIEDKGHIIKDEYIKVNGSLKEFRVVRWCVKVSNKTLYILNVAIPKL